MLTSYITWNLTGGKRRNFSIIGYIVIRYCRLTPQIIVFILLTFLIPLVNDGPLWNRIVVRQVSKCYDTWWANLLYIQNYDSNMVSCNWLTNWPAVKSQSFLLTFQCALHTWWLATEYQLHLLSLIVILALFISSKLAYFVTSLIIIINSSICGWLIYSYSLGPGLANTQRQ